MPEGATSVMEAIAVWKPVDRAGLFKPANALAKALLSPHLPYGEPELCTDTFIEGITQGKNIKNVYQP